MPHADPKQGATNHPLATRMAIIAFVYQNITIGCLWSSVSVMLTAAEGRYGVGRELSTAAVPAVTLMTALGAPLAGAVAGRISIRAIMLLGASLSIGGFLLLAFSAAYLMYLVAYGLLLGSGMAIVTVLPATLVTRWFVVHRGRALGIVCLPLAAAVMPLVIDVSLRRLGASGTYGLLAVVSFIPFIANLFVVDVPPVAAGEAVSVLPHRGNVAAAGPTTIELLGTPSFWALGLAFIASITGSMLLSANMVPITLSWGLSARVGAMLLAVQSLAGMLGTVLFGWLADTIGGALSLALVSLGAAILWLSLLLHWPLMPTMLIVGLIGMHGSGAIPALGIAFSEALGRDGFGRAYGLLNFINLPFAVGSVPLAAFVATRTSSYSGTLLGESIFLLLGGLLALAARNSRGKRGPCEQHIPNSVNTVRLSN